MFKKEFLDAVCFPGLEANEINRNCALVPPGPERRSIHFRERLDLMMCYRTDSDEVSREDVLDTMRGIARMRAMALMGAVDPRERQEIDRVFVPIAQRISTLSKRMGKPILQAA